MFYVSRLTCYLLEIWLSICSRRLICEYLVILFSICVKASGTSCGTNEMYSVNYPLICTLRRITLLDSLLGIVWNSTVPWDGSLEMCRIWPGNYVRLIGDDVLFIHKKCLFFNSLKLRRVFISVQSFPSIDYKMWPLKWHYISIWTSTFDWYFFVISVNKLCAFIWIYLTLPNFKRI